VTFQPSSLLHTARTSPLLQVLLIGFLILLLQIPIAMINGLIGERRDTRDEVMQDVTGKWGGSRRSSGRCWSFPTFTAGARPMTRGGP